jgi:hypothetical protein
VSCLVFVAVEIMQMEGSWEVLKQVHNAGAEIYLKISLAPADQLSALLTQILFRSRKNYDTVQIKCNDTSC